MHKLITDFPISRYGADAQDVRAVKRALNRIGYYTPDRAIGITDELDERMLRALDQFRTDHDLKATTYTMPRDRTIKAINRALDKLDPRQRYTWQTVGDERVRDEHADREGDIFRWGHPPEGGHPGEDYNCRCWAEVIDVPSLRKSQTVMNNKKRMNRRSSVMMT